MKKQCENKNEIGKNQATAWVKQETLNSFIRDSGDAAYHYALKLTGNCEEANELVQEALYRALKAWNRYDPSKPFNRWLFRILRNAFLDNRGRFERQNIMSLDVVSEVYDSADFGDILPGGGESPLKLLEREETIATMRRILCRLSENHRAMLQLHDIDGVAYQDIARSRGLPIGTIRSRISRARQAFRHHWPQAAIA